MTIVPNLQEATTSDSDSERTLYDRPNRTSRTDRAESGHDSSEIFFPYTAPFSSIVPALTSFTKQPQVTSFQPLKETKWQRPPFLPTLNSHPRLVYPIVVLTLLSAGLITGLVVFVIHQNHILVGEESSPDNEGKDDGQELSPLILFIDAVFIIFIIGTISILLLLIYRFSTKFRHPPLPSSTTRIANPLDFLPGWCRTTLPSLPTYGEAVIGASGTIDHQLEMTLPVYEDNRNSRMLMRSQSRQNVEDRGGSSVSVVMTDDEGNERQVRSPTQEQRLTSYWMSELVLPTAKRQSQIHIQSEPRSSSLLDVIVEDESVMINMEDIKERGRIGVEEGGVNGDEGEVKEDEIEVWLEV